MRILPRAVVTAAMLCLLAACSSTPVSQHYLLTAPPPATLPTQMTPALGVGPIVIPEYLNRDSLVRRSNSNRLLISSTERWAEPLEDGILRVVGLNLAGLLSTQNIRIYPWHPDFPPEYGVKLRVVEMDATADNVTITAEWFVYRSSDDSTVARRLSTTTTPLATTDADAPADANELVATYSRLLYGISVEIAEAIRAAMSSEGSAVASVN